MKQNTFIYIGIITLLIGVVLFVNPTGLNLGCVGCTSGFTVESITSTQIISNNEQLANTNFIVKVSVDGSNEQIVGLLDEGEFAKWKSNIGNIRVTYPLQISIGSVKETLNYAVQNQGQMNMYTVTTATKVNWWDASPSCGTSSGIVACYKAGDTTYTVWKQPIGSQGTLSLTSFPWEADMTVSINGVPTTQKIGSNFQSVNFMQNGELIATAKDVGSYITRDVAPDGRGFHAQHTAGNAKWQISEEYFYTNYVATQTIAETNIGVLISKLNSNTCTRTASNNYKGCDVEIQNIISIVSTQKQQYDTMMARDVKIDSASVTHSVTGDIITEIANRKYGIPNLVLHVKASKLGVLILTGKPEIIPPIDAPSFSSGDNVGIARINVKNIGDASGTFIATLENSGIFYQDSSTLSSRITLAPGTSGTIGLNIGHGTASSGLQNALIKVCDVNAPSNCDTEPLTITMTAPKKYTPNQYITEGDVVWLTSADGMSRTVYLDCTGKGLLYENGAYICQYKPTPIPTLDATPNPDETPGSGLPGDYNEIKWYETLQAQLLALTLIVLAIAIYLRRKP